MRLTLLNNLKWMIFVLDALLENFGVQSNLENQAKTITL